MKIINKILLCPLIFVISTAIAEPYNSHIKSASIHLDKTNKVYANGRMQAPIKVRHELASGVKLKSIRLKRMHFAEDLNTLGWRVSTKDAGFAKVIEDLNAPPSHRSNTAQNTWMYVSAENRNRNSRIHICVELVTSLHGKEKSYDTCHDSGKADGSVIIYAIPEIYYDPEDFYLEGEGRITGGLNEEIHHVTLKKQNIIPRNMTFKVEEGIPHIDQDQLWLDNSYSSINYWVKGPRFRSNISAYIAQKGKKLTFNWTNSPLHPRKRQFTIPVSNDADTIFNVIVYYLHQFEFLSQNNRCVKVKGSCNYKCIDQHTLATSCKKSVNTQNKEFQDILLLDNYGNDVHLIMKLNRYTGEPYFDN